MQRKSKDLTNFLRSAGLQLEEDTDSDRGGVSAAGDVDGSHQEGSGGTDGAENEGEGRRPWKGKSRATRLSHVD